MEFLKTLEEHYREEQDSDVLISEFSRLQQQIKKKEKLPQAAEHDQFVEKLIEILPKLRQSYYEACCDPMLTLALYLGEKQIMSRYYQNGHAFSVKEIVTKIDLALYIMSRILDCQDLKFQLIIIYQFLESHIPIQHKLILNELLVHILPAITSKHLHYYKLIPTILSTLQAGISKFAAYKERAKNSEEMMEDTKQFMQNFQEWCLSTVNRVSEQLVNLPEVTACKEEKQPFEEKAKPETILKHYVILYFMDVFQGIIEGELNQVFDSEPLNKFFQYQQSLLYKVSESPIVILDNAVNHIKYNRMHDIKPPQIIHAYQPDMRYNITSCTYLLIQQFKYSRVFNEAYSRDYHIDLLFNIYTEFAIYDLQKTNLLKELVDIFTLLFKDKREIKEKISNPNFYNAPVYQILAHSLEYAGAHQNKEQIKYFKAAVENILEQFTDSAQISILKGINDCTSNQGLAAFVVDTIRGATAKHLKDLQLDAKATPYLSFKAITEYLQFLLNKNQEIQLADKQDLISSILVFYKFLVQKCANLSQAAPDQVQKLDPDHLLSISAQKWYADTLKKAVDALDQLITKQIEQVNYSKEEMAKKSEKLLEQQAENVSSRQGQLSFIRFQTSELLDAIKLLSI